MINHHTEVSDFAQELVATPRAHITIELRQEIERLSITYQDIPLIVCRITREGMTVASYIARALGVKIPQLHKPTTVKISTGVLFRVISIASLDFGIEESYLLLERWLEEADLQRGAPNESS